MGSTESKELQIQNKYQKSIEATVDVFKNRRFLRSYVLNQLKEEIKQQDIKNDTKNDSKILFYLLDFIWIYFTG